MSNSHMTFIVGAGASAEVDLPVGGELKNKIAEALDIQFEYFNQIKGDLRITQALRDYVRINGANQIELENLIRKCRHIRDNIKYARSIDHYLDAHRDDAEVVLCGKIAIAKMILDAESNSRLRIVGHNNKYNDDLVVGTWYNLFFQMITSGVSKSQVNSIFDRINIISFNYDRCIEHFLVQRLCEFYDIRLSDAEQVVRKLRIYHPYGQVGFLPWQSNGGVRFGDGMGADLLSISKEIKIFTERMDDKEKLDEIKNAVSDSEILVFLGFAYHEQNLDLIKPHNYSRTRRIFGTATGISSIDQNTIKRDLRSMIKHEAEDITNLDIKILEVTCEGFFEKVSRTLNATKVS